jgi:hypothetical protein
VFAGESVHGDETPVPVLAKHETRKGRHGPMCTTTNRSQAQLHQLRCSSIREVGLRSIQSIICAIMPGSCRPMHMPAFNRLYESGRKTRPITVASCWAHGRRKFFELADVTAKVGCKLRVIAPLAFGAVKRINAIFDVEREIIGRPIDERLAVRRARVAPVVSDLERWMRTEYAKLSRHSDVAKAMNYMLTRWNTCTRFLNKGRIASPTMRPSARYRHRTRR